MGGLTPQDESREHIPVMAGPTLELLQVQAGGTYVDCTAGAGGHSSLIAEALSDGRLVSLDRDPDAVALAKARLSQYPQATVYHRNYGQLSDVIEELGLKHVDGILIDAGVSSMQIDEAERGFSFQNDGPLDMRMDTSSGMTAAAYLSRISESALAGDLKQYGDIGPAKRIAKSIVRARESGNMDRTDDLVAAVCNALDFVQGVPAEVRTVFQAIRMAINEELRWLMSGLEQGIDVLRPGGRLVVLSFHSGEDRVVKQVMRRASRKQREFHDDGRVRSEAAPRVRLVMAKPVVPTEKEIRENSRAKSAKLRAVERI
jgi:16S rRNA (cytosine1402-N4)-methyltransferase